MTISSEPTGALVTLETVRRVRQELGCNTILGVSNISFGLPQREIVNSNFFTMAMQSGLTAAIINPNSAAMMRSYYSYRALAALDEHCGDYIEQAARLAIPKAGAGGASGAGAAGSAVRVPRRQVQLELPAVRTLAARHPVRSISLRSVWREV